MYHRQAHIVDVVSERDKCLLYLLNISLPENQFIVPTSSSKMTALLQKTLRFVGAEVSHYSLTEYYDLYPEIKTETDKIYSLTNQSDEISYTEIYNAIYPSKHINSSNLHSYFASEKFVNKPLVIATDSQFSNQAALYALLSGDPLFVATDIESLDEVFFELSKNTKSFFISCSPHLSSSTLNSLFRVKNRCRNRVPIGFFYPFGNLEREFFSIKTLIFKKFNLQRNLPFNFVFPLESKNISNAQGPFNFFFGIGESYENVLATLKKPAEFLFSTPHSNGINMSLGNVVLCAKKGSYSTEKFSHHVHPCFLNSNLCNRKKENNILLAPEEVQSLVVFLYTCWGILLKNGLYDVRASLGRQLATSPYTASLISTYTMSYLDRYAGHFFLEQYIQNEPVGKIVRDYNEEHFLRYNDTKQVVVLIGNPEFNRSHLDDIKQLEELLPSVENYLNKIIGPNPQKNPSPLSHKEQHLIPQTFFSFIDFTRCIISGTREINLPVLQKPLTQLSSATEKLWSFSLQFNSRVNACKEIPFSLRNMQSILSSHTILFQESWYQFYLSMVSHLGGYIRLQIDKYFYREVSIEKTETYLPCPYCNGDIHENFLTMAGSPQIKRRVQECFNCATVFDGAAEFTSGKILCNQKWDRSKEQDICIYFHCDQKKEVNYLIGAILEPFIKGNPENVSKISMQGLLGGKGIIPFKLRLPPMHIHKSYASGIHFLNVIIIVGNKILTLRRGVILV